MANQPKVFATLAWGFGPERWGAIGFSLETVRNQLADELRKAPGLVLTMGTMGSETAELERGRLLGIHRLGTRPVATEELVEPSYWSAHLTDNGGRAKWPFGLPIISAERFIDLPRRAQILPRLHDENLHRKLASGFEVLTAEEAARVLACRREAVTEIWRTPRGAFVANVLAARPKGPPPARTQRLLTPKSGAAATYCFRLGGWALRHAARDILLGWPSELSIFKVGFSNDPDRRQRELNAYLPDESALGWEQAWSQWHGDEINAWAMEQAVFEVLARRCAKRIKGEIYAVREIDMQSAFIEAQRIAVRPRGPVTITAGAEEIFIQNPDE